jgi:tetratricopeptide (TPR) repeat protein/tRNA A-37 threonylcarbamoyl transferase component Bud32
MALDPLRVKALFNAALDLPDPADRPAFLYQECGSDPELRQRLEDLLAAHDRPASALERPLAGDPGERSAQDAVPGPTASIRPATPPPDPLIGRIVAGRYKLRQEIGEGGMGSVYLAEQLQPVKRQVALKLIKPGMDSRTVLARFDSERQALALMDHPNIARVLDAGVTDAGRPFFIMDLVKGIPLTDYCDQHRLGVPERLALFRQICSAVQHAHQKGIIHRDLKPSNILVESHDGHPVPKVIDFGLAKATSGLQLTEQSLFTAFGTVAGTPLYMAPEQASFNALDVDTRADIYALGVILYELLTGSTPIRRETIQRAALDEVLRVIREVEPPTPSSRISTSEALPAIAATRQTEPARLGRFVRGDLDWIVMKALAKERQRRYESAIALAQDLERFEHHEPVSAGPPTATYRLRKFVRRNRAQVLAATLTLLALVMGVVGTTIGLLKARRQEGIAVAEAREKEQARQAEALQRKNADEQRRQAEKRLTQIEKANEILGSIFKDLQPGIWEQENKPLSALLGQRLDQAAAQVEGEAIGDPLTVARTQMTLGRSLRGLGYPEKAIALLTKARATFFARLGSDHTDTLMSMYSLALAYQQAGKYDRALPLFEETLALRKAKLGPDHPDTFQARYYLAGIYEKTGQYDRAIPLREEAVELWKAKLGPNHPSTLIAMNNLAYGYRIAGKPDRALPLFEDALEKAQNIGAHRATILTMNNIAYCYQHAGQNDRGLPLVEKAMALSQSKFGPDHSETLGQMGILASFYQEAGKFDRALSLLKEILEVRKAKVGPDHPNTLASMNDLARGYQAAGQLGLALPLFEETLTLRKVKLGPDHPGTLTSMNDLARCYQAAGQPDRALRLGRELTDLWKRRTGTDSMQYADALASLARNLLQQEKWTEAETVLLELLAIREAQAPDDWRTFNTKAMLGRALLGQKNFAAAEPLLRVGYEGMKVRAEKIPPQGKPRLAEALDRLIALAEATNQPDDARKWKDERAKLPAASASKLEEEDP